MAEVVDELVQHWFIVFELRLDRTGARQYHPTGRLYWTVAAGRTAMAATGASGVSGLEGVRFIEVRAIDDPERSTSIAAAEVERRAADLGAIAHSAPARQSVY